MAVPYWRLSSFYLCYFATLGAFIPYWSLYLKAYGFNSAEIGQLSALLVGTKIIAPNLWGWIADRSHQGLHIIRWTSFYATVLFAWFLTAHNYLEFAVLTVFFSFFWNAPLPLYEAITLSHLRDDSHHYSRIRLWGSVGFILTVMGIGRLLDSQPILILPILVTGLLVLMWFTALVTPATRVISHEQKSPIRLSSIIKKPEVIAFLLVYVLIQVAHAPYYVFYSIYLKDHLYTSATTGLLWSSGVIAEVVLFLVMKGVLMHYSLRGILLTSLVLAALRWLLIGAYVDNVWVLLLAQLLHAASFGGVHIAAIHFVQRFFDRQHQSKGQALYHSLSFGLGGMVGSLLSGHYWEILGSHVIYSAAAISCVFAFIIAFIWVGKEDYCYT
jgi:PPP family 3-phenylpropionic acid transporter